MISLVAPSELLLLLDLLADHLINIEVGVCLAASLNLFLPLHQPEDLHVSFAFALRVVLQLRQSLIALLLDDLLRVGCLRLVLADLLVELAHRGSAQLRELQTLIECLPLALLHLLLPHLLFLLVLATLQDLGDTFDRGLSMLHFQSMHLVLNVSQLLFLLLQLFLLLLNSERV